MEEKTEKLWKTYILRAVVCVACAAFVVGGGLLVWLKMRRGAPALKPVSSRLVAVSGESIPEEMYDAADHWEDALADEAVMMHDPIAASLQKAMEAKPESMLFRVMVYVPGRGEYIDRYQEEGVSLQELKTGSWKQALEGLPAKEALRVYQDTMEKMEKMEDAAAKQFTEEAIRSYGSDRARPNQSTEYIYEQYIFTDVLSQQDIRKLADQGCRVTLALRERPEEYSDAVTERLALLMKTGEKHEVLISLRLDNLQDSQRYSPAYYRNRRLSTPNDRISRTMLQEYIEAFAADHSLEYMQKTASLSYTASDYADIRCILQGILTNEQILTIAADDRVGVISPAEAYIILGADE